MPLRSWNRKTSLVTDAPCVRVERLRQRAVTSCETAPVERTRSQRITNQYISETCRQPLTRIIHHRARRDHREMIERNLAKRRGMTCIYTVSKRCSLGFRCNFFLNNTLRSLYCYQVKSMRLTKKTVAPAPKPVGTRAGRPCDSLVAAEGRAVVSVV